MNKFLVIKEASKIIGGMGVGAVASNVIQATSPDNITRVQRGLTFVGGFVISSMVSDAASDYIEKKLEKLDARFIFEQSMEKDA